MWIHFIENRAWLGKTRSCSMHWAGESSATVGWPSQAVQMQVGVLNINILMAFTWMLFSRRIFLLLLLLSLLLRVLGSSSQKKSKNGECVSLGGFLITDKTCGKSHWWTFSFITQQDLALIFLRNLPLSVSLFMQFDCYNMYSSWNFKSIEWGPTSSKWPLTENSVIFEILDVNGSPLPFQRSWAFMSVLKWSMSCS